MTGTGERRGAGTSGTESAEGAGAAHTELIWPGKYDADGRRVPLNPEEEALAPQLLECHGAPCREETIPGGNEGLLIGGDNLAALAALLPEAEGRVDLVYMDPPFGVGVSFRGGVEGGSRRSGQGPLHFADPFRDGPEGYVAAMARRLELIARLLAPTGAVFVHCDWRVEHLWRSLLDDRFGPDRFRNRIAWSYGGAGRGAKAVARQLPRNHDAILWYSAGEDWTFHPPERERLLSAEEARRAGYRRDEEGRWFKTAPRGDYTDASIRRLEGEGRIHRTRTGSIRIKYFLPERRGMVVERSPLGDVWGDIPDAMHLPRAQRTGYSTQKPLTLLERILAMASDPGDLVLDPFLGSGTTAEAARRLGRRWIGVDAGRRALATARARLLAAAEEDQGGFRVASLARAGWAALARERGEERLRRDLLELFGADPVSGQGAVHARREGAAVHLWHPMRPLQREEMMDLAAELRARGEERAWVLAGDLAPGVAALARALAERGGPRVCFALLPGPEALAAEGGEEAGFSLPPVLKLRVQRTGSELRVEVVDFRPGGKITRGESAREGSGDQLLAFVAGTLPPEGGCLQTAAAAAARGPGSCPRELVLPAGIEERGRLVVRASDRAGNTVTEVVERPGAGP